MSESPQLIEAEVKYLSNTLDGIRPEVIAAMVAGEAHEALPNRGTVIQSYLKVSPSRVRDVIESMNAHKIEFGDKPTQQSFIENIQNVREIRVLQKPAQNISQITIKGKATNGGLLSKQLETAGDAQTSKLIEHLASDLVNLAEGLVRKFWFDIDMIIDGKINRVELDILTSHKNLIVSETEVELPASEAVIALRKIQKSKNIPDFMSLDVTDHSILKSASLAFLEFDELPLEIRNFRTTFSSFFESQIDQILKNN